MDVREFYAAYRSDGWGAAAYDPGMIVAILLYAYCLGLRSSRRIARALEEDVGFRVVVANRQPDFRTICRFRAEQEEALEELFVEVLRLCHEARLYPRDRADGSRGASLQGAGWPPVPEQPEATWERPSRSARDARAPDTGGGHHDTVSSPTSLSMWSFRNLEL